MLHGTYLTDLEGLNWVKVTGLRNYRNAIGTQSQGIVVKPLRGVPNPDREEAEYEASK